MKTTMPRDESGADSILGDFDEFIASIDHALDGTDQQRSRRAVGANIVSRIARDAITQGLVDPGKVRPASWRRVGHLAAAAREPLRHLMGHGGSNGAGKSNGTGAGR